MVLTLCLNYIIIIIIIIDIHIVFNSPDWLQYLDIREYT